MSRQDRSHQPNGRYGKIFRGRPSASGRLVALFLSNLPSSALLPAPAVVEAPEQRLQHVQERAGDRPAPLGACLRGLPFRLLPTQPLLHCAHPLTDIGRIIHRVGSLIALHLPAPRRYRGLSMRTIWLGAGWAQRLPLLGAARLLRGRVGGPASAGSVTSTGSGRLAEPEPSWLNVRLHAGELIGLQVGP